ncbi:hypothetical protein NX774_08160 [Massilia agilis]|uniref:Uncharacterized protein n=1 Tax=Massilia agilis TaxID=1811226 RepID=A0ABT2D9D3_9BURK|nr:hypothetical protein [Massilia agilis]MCS0807895.1 hypothetical protein [Massilia agilis]
MEVVINGELTPAADGIGWRAFATGPNGITEHARLLDADKLQNMINCAAVWQLASVIVAQKHLADISRKLDEIAKGVRGISNFLDDERRSMVEGAYSWLRQAIDAVTAGEMTPAVRHQLEGVERDLESILNHLIREFRRELLAPVKEDSIGTEDQTDGLVRKAKHLEELGGTWSSACVRVWLPGTC